MYRLYLKNDCVLSAIISYYSRLGYKLVNNNGGRVLSMEKDNAASIKLIVKGV